MIRHFACVAALIAALCPCNRLSAAFRSEIISETTANHHGLTRPWFTQIQMNRGQGRVRYVALHEDAIYVQTDRAMVHAIDAETGETLWAKPIGRFNHPSMEPGLSQDLLAVVNGSRLYVCNRFNGNLLYEVEVGGAPGAGAAMSEERAYVPMVDGMVMAYRLKPITDPLHELGKIKKNLTEEDKAELEQDRRDNLRLRKEYIPPLSCRSVGRAMVQPLVTRQNEGEEFCIWPTDRGFLNIGRVDRRSEDRLAIKWRLETAAGIAARPTYKPPNPKVQGDSGIILAASQDGFVHAIEENTGDSLWRFSTGEPILEPAVVVDDYVYVATQPGGMYCIDSKTGGELWWTPRVKQFIAASKERLYVADKIGRMLVLHAKSGARIDTCNTETLPIKLVNADNDRIYLATRTGLIQCLRELENVEPVLHGAKRLAAEAEKKQAVEQKGMDELEGQPDAGLEAAGAEDPFGDGGEDPFGDGGEDPFGGGAAPAEDPFGGGAAPAEDPFGAGAAPAEDPFGAGNGGGDNGGGAAAEDPFANDDDPFN